MHTPCIHARPRGQSISLKQAPVRAVQITDELPLKPIGQSHWALLFEMEQKAPIPHLCSLHGSLQ